MWAFANDPKDDWDAWLPNAVFAINNLASILGGDLTLFFIDRGQHPRLPLSLADLRAAGESRRPMQLGWRPWSRRCWRCCTLRSRSARLDQDRVDTTFQVGDQKMLLTKELLAAAEEGKLRPR